jgi:flagellar biosynthetic protein FlhB
MAEQTGEKTEQPTPRRLEDALKKGQLAQSAEVQTVFVLFGFLAALTFAGHEIWQQFVSVMAMTLGHLHDTPITFDSLQGYGVSGTFVLLKCVGPIVLATVLAGLVAGGSIASDPIFTSAVSTERLAEFMGGTCLRIFLRVGLGLIVIAAADYSYQFWRTSRDLMMTKQELKEELKNSEASQRIKAARRKRRAVTKAQALAEIPKADVVVTNPTHIAIALRYDRKTMRAPKVVAKGIRLNAEKIREIAQQHQVPIVENKPLARMLFKHGRVGGEIPAQLYATVAEILAWVYQVNRYRYYTEQNQI